MADAASVGILASADPLHENGSTIRRLSRIGDKECCRFALRRFVSYGSLQGILARVAHSGAAMQTVQDHLYYYHHHLLRSWHNMTPGQYGCLLIMIAVIGWIMMKSGAR